MGTEDHFGRWLRRQIENIPLEIKAFALKADIPEQTVRYWLRQEKPPIRAANVVRVATALGLQREEIERRLKPEIDLNVDPYSEVKTHAVPVFDLAVAAGTWVDVSEFAELRHPGQIDAGLFRMRVRGDSMTPAYKDGSLVEFQCLREGRDELVVGADYYVQVDGQGTFKRLVEISEETLVFRAVNRRKYPKPMPARRAEVLRMARAIYCLTPV